MLHLSNSEALNLDADDMAKRAAAIQQLAVMYGGIPKGAQEGHLSYP